MCGICGQYSFESGAKVDEETIRKMCCLLTHRGPDEEGIYLKNNIGLGHRRLSIIDLDTGHQPMFNEDKSVAIIFNGEIYNFRSLRSELEKEGHRFRTRSDTEVIIHLYEEHGDRCVDFLRGMFAIAIWDERFQKIFLARDRVGQKPLYYTVWQGSFFFASEMKSLLTIQGLSREVNFEALDDFLTFQYVPAPRTIFKNISKLPPASYLVCHDGNVTTSQYWQLEYEPKQSLTLEDAREEFLAKFNDAVKCRLESDVPLGCFLSGGIDSSAVVAFMRDNVSGSLRTFSIGFEEEEFNELPYARMIAEKFETDHTELIVKPDAIGVLPKLVWHFDEPYADYSALPTYYLSKMTRQHVTVALNGDGGDESFAGYQRYAGLDLLNRYRTIPRLIREYCLKPALVCGQKILPNSVSLDSAKYLNDISLYGDDLRYIQMLLIFKKDFRQRLFSKEFSHLVSQNQSEERLLRLMTREGASELIDRQLRVDVETYLPGDLLAKVDRTTMAFGLEGRSPFLDHHLMEWAAKLPASIKFHNGTLKSFLKHSLRTIVPDEILFRRKQGFGIPLAAWLRNELKDFAEDLLFSGSLSSRGFFNMDYVRRLFDSHCRNRTSHHHRLWALMSFEIWCRTFLDRADISSGAIRL